MPLESWLPVPPSSPFPVQCLPLGVFSPAGGTARCGAAIGDRVLDLAPALDDPVFAAPTLNAFLARGPAGWAGARARLTELLTQERYAGRVAAYLHRLADVMLHLPVAVGDFVDFYASEEHATNLGRLLRPDGAALLPNWRHLPVGYHGRAGTVVPSGTPIVRPRGQRRGPGGTPVFGPTERLDVEVEVGFVVGTPSPLGRPVPVGEFAEHVFGVVLVNDWSARDIQAWEYQPLGPFLGKSFATSVSPWVIPLAALDAARLPGPPQDPPPLPYLARDEPWGLDLDLELRLGAAVVSRPPYAGMYWTPAQMLAHLTVNGAALRTGDLFASGTVSGPSRDSWGSLIELTQGGRDPLHLPDATTRTFLADGDIVTISATAPGADGVRIGLGEVTGTVRPAGWDPDQPAQRR